MKQSAFQAQSGDVTIYALSLREIKKLMALFEKPAEGSASMFRYLPFIAASVAGPALQGDLSGEQYDQIIAAETQKLELKLILEEFQPLFDAVLELSGLKKQAQGESIAPAKVN